MSQAPETDPTPRPVKLLFVCIGNICRSPAGEGILEKMSEKRGLGGRIVCESAGTLRDFEGLAPDARMVAAASQRGYALRSTARQFRYEDFERFDMILSMDRFVTATLRDWAREPSAKSKIREMVEFHPDRTLTDVPDPFLGTAESFEEVLDVLEVACGNLLERVTADNGLEKV